MRSVMLALGLLVWVSLAHAQPVVPPGSVVNDANYSAQGVAPGTLIAIFGTSLATAIPQPDTIPLSTSWSDVMSVTFNDIPAGLFFVTPGQINAQFPFDVLKPGQTSGTATIVVNHANGSSAPQTVNVVPASPGIFTANATGLGQAIATDNDDNAIAAPVGSIPGLTTHPISIGSGHPLIVWCTGLGSVTPPPGSPPIANNVPAAAVNGQFWNTALKPTVLIGGVAATPVYSILSPQFVSEYQIGVVPAAGTPTGDAVSLQIQMVINGVTVTTTNQATIAVAP
jgi:uncharacterized protein (TIGR03437 family)